MISRSDKPTKKYVATQGSRKVHVGQAGASDFRIHRDEQRKQRYLARHRANENWTKSGAMTAGFLSRYLLWNEETLEKSVAKLNRKYSDLRFRLR